MLVSEHIQKVDHVAIALPSIADSVPLFCDILGARFISGGDNDDTGLRLVHLMLPNFKLELLQPLREDSIVSESLERRGPGLHHITFFVDDVRRTADAFAAEGFHVTGTNVSVPAWTETFLRPKDTFGALLQFVGTNRNWDVPSRDFGLEDVLAGRVVYRDYVACVRG
jgi:methylmalonyl-CoA/ethylmalonyl-CoA epimerase